MRRWAGWTGTIALGIASAAAAQSGPSFDCAKAATAIEKAICSDKEASAADRKMAEAYRRLLASLANPAARAHLERDQVLWVVDRQRICGPRSAPSRTGRAMPDCLREVSTARAEALEALPSGAAYAFVGERRLVEHGRRGGAAYEIAIGYPVFEFHEVDYSRANAAIKGWADKLAADVRPPAQGTPGGPPDIGWFLEGGHVMHAASPQLVTVAAYWQAFTGGAHPSSGRIAWQVELTTGRLLTLDDILSRTSGWQDGVTRLVRADLKKQFVERPGSDDALEPASLRKQVVEQRRWVFTKDKVVLTFDPYEVGPYAAGPYEVELPYAALAPYIRKDGPLGGRTR